jgi:hypothetical protein
MKPAPEKLYQRADYTHKFNSRTGRHGWLRLTPAYSVKVVEEFLQAVDRPLSVLDPFCGTSTTGLSAAYYGHAAVTVEINPFLVWFGKAKTGHYTPAAIANVRRACTRALDLVKTEAIDLVPAPPIHNIERWWPRPALLFLQRLQASIEAVSEADTPERALLQVAFCRSLIKLSNAAFNHQSMSFRDDRQIGFDIGLDAAALFREDVNFVLAGAAENPAGSCDITQGDARDIPKATDRKFDLLITSPPYVNRMSYIRELRPYMYWLGYLVNARDAGELDWSSIGGTWGIATSRLIDWKPDREAYQLGRLKDVLDRISHKDNANGALLANYIEKYFGDMWVHFKNLRGSLAEGARIHYIIGNSTFYGVLLPVEQIYADMLHQLGFAEINICPIRKRNSKKELIEFDVSASWDSQGDSSAIRHS